MRTSRVGRLPLLVVWICLPGGLVGGLAAPAFASAPAFTAYSVDFTYFSPDGDKDRDVVVYSFTFSDSRCRVTVSVHADSSGVPGGLKRILFADSLSAGNHSYPWDGKDSTGTITDGAYQLVATAENTEGTASAAVRVVVDRVAPIVEVLQVDNPYTPDLPDRERLATVRLRVSQLGEKDRVNLAFRRRATPAAGDSTYTALLDTIPLTAGGEFDVRHDLSDLPDGMYYVKARVYDEAAHADTTFGPDLNLDVAAPTEKLDVPSSQYRNTPVTEVRGSVSDRSSISLLVVRVSSAGGALADSLCTPLAPCLADTVVFTVLVPDSIGARDTVTVQVAARDFPGHYKEFTHVVFVDTLPPPAPEIDPASVPAQIGRPGLENVSGTAGGGAEQVAFYLDGDSVATTTVSAGAFARSLEFAGLQPGEHSLTARSRDRVGNRSEASLPQTFTYEEKLGVQVPEQYRVGDLIQVNLGGPGQSVSVFIYTLHGKRVRTFEAGPSSSPFYEFRWDLLDTDGESVGNGPYIIRVVADQADGTRLEKRVATMVVK